MMFIRSLIVTALLASVINSTVAQQSIPGKDLVAYIEDLVSLGYSELDAIDLYEEIEALKSNPVKINSESKKEIERLFFLTPFQVKSLIDYTRYNGSILSIFEIRYIAGFDRNLALLMSDYIVFNGEKTQKGFNNHDTKINSILIYSSRDREDYPGSRLKTATRLLHRSGPLSIGLTLEKDRGETFIDQNGLPEFYSGYVEFSGVGPFEKVIAGDFRVRFGQGLTVWHGYSPGTSPLNPNPVRGSSRVAGYSSTDENNYFRGVAASGRVKSVSYNIYLSANKIDGSKDYTSDSSIFIRSLYDGGLHNTTSTLQKKDVLTEYSAGININSNFNLLNLGLSVTGTLFSPEIIPETNLENYYDFKGSGNMAFAIDHAASLNKIYIFGESAINSDSKFSTIQGIRLIPVDRVRLNLLYGVISRGYISFHGHIFGKETVNNFRKSILSNIQLDIAKGLTLSAGILKHSDSWFGYRSGNFPGSSKYMAEIVSQPFEHLTIKATGWIKESMADINAETGIETSRSVATASGRIHLDITASSSLRLITRFEVSHNTETGENGFLAYQGVKYNPDNLPLKFALRFYTYAIDSYDTRIYAWEDDLQYSPSIPAFYGKGNRSYLMVDFTRWRAVSFRIKFGVTEYINEGIPVLFTETRLQVKIRI